jgi:hypothetical protein
MAFLYESLGQSTVEKNTQYERYIHQSTVLFGHLDDMDPKMVSGVDHVKLIIVNRMPSSQQGYPQIKPHSQCSAVEALPLAHALGARAQAHREAAGRRRY